MAFGSTAHLPKCKPLFISYFFKPTFKIFAKILAALFKVISPPKTYSIERILRASDLAALKLWKSEAMRKKMRPFAYIIAAFCEADNTYFRFLDTFCECYILLKKKNL
jgi:hypothetical protein